MKIKYISMLTAITIAILATGATLAQDAGSDGADRDRGGERGKGMPRRGQRGPIDPERAISMMTRHLELDETQVQQVRNIYLAAKPEFDSLREQGRNTRMAMRELDADDAEYDANKQSLSQDREGIAASAEALRERIRTEIEVVLTPEQREKFAAGAERGRERGQRNRQRSRSGPEA